jgi:uncharacterized protein YbbK (DUF523 family)
MKIVSACLAGVHCRYDCASQEREEIRLMVERGEALPVCPEQLGGLSTPRPPAEIVGAKVLTNTGVDVTPQYQRGAAEALKLAELGKCQEACLKSKSPMCGSGLIYDGTFSGQLTDGDGVFAALLKSKGITFRSID